MKAVLIIMVAITTAAAGYQTHQAAVIRRQMGMVIKLKQDRIEIQDGHIKRLEAEIRDLEREIRQGRR